MKNVFFFVTYFVGIHMAFAETPSTYYQVDVIVLAHQVLSSVDDVTAASRLAASSFSKTIPLQPGEGEVLSPYHLLSASRSSLRNEYWALRHKADFQVLAHYSWLQPVGSQQAVSLPSTSKGSWDLAGSIRVRQTNFYQVDTHLVFSDAKTHQSKFVFAQNQRLKPNVVYYFDHPQAGLLVKISKVKSVY